MDMTPEFIVLAATLVLALVQILAAGAARTAELGGKWNAGPRDGDPPPPGKLAGRLKRAQDNLFETLPLFIAAVLMAVVVLASVGAHAPARLRYYSVIYREVIRCHGGPGVSRLDEESNENGV